MAAVTDDNTRQVEIWESSSDLNALSNGRFQLQFAKSVIGKDGRLDFNIVWQSKNLAPRTSISWVPIYALNWTLALPSQGIAVTVGGEWQLCALGQSYDLNQFGFWEKSPGAITRPDFMNVGRNYYQYSGQSGVNILIGLKNPWGGFDVIYVDPVKLGLNMSAWYQPQEEVRWWYETGSRTASLISGAGTATQTYNLSAPDPSTRRFYVSSTYLYQSGRWTTSPNPPSPILETGVLGSAQAGRKSGSHSGGKFDTGDESGQLAGSGNQYLLNKIESIEKALLSLSTMLSSGGGTQSNRDYSYRGSVSFRPGTQERDLEGAATVMAQSLRGHGYQATTFTKEAEATSFVGFKPQSNPTDVRDAWADAVEALHDSPYETFGPTDDGFVTIPPNTRSSNGQGEEGTTETNGRQGDDLHMRKATARAILANAG